MPMPPRRRRLRLPHSRCRELPRGETINIAKLHAMAIGELNSKAKELGVENFGTMKKHEVVFAILQKNAERRGVLFAEGVLEVMPEGYGFLLFAQLLVPRLPGGRLRLALANPAL